MSHIEGNGRRFFSWYSPLKPSICLQKLANKSSVVNLCTLCLMIRQNLWINIPPRIFKVFLKVYGVLCQFFNNIYYFIIHSYYKIQSTFSYPSLLAEARILVSSSLLCLARGTYLRGLPNRTQVWFARSPRNTD